MNAKRLQHTKINFEWRNNLSIISTPDFIGKHPKKQNSIKLVKCVDKNIMVCIELSRGYVMYPL